MAKRLDHVPEVGVSNHAIEKLRERLPPGCSLNSLADKDLRALLQRAWTYAKDAGAIGVWWERGANGAPEINHVVDLSEVMEGELVGVAREDARTPGKPCYITVITAAMAERSKASKKWVASVDELLVESEPRVAPEETFMLSWEEGGQTQVVISTRGKVQDLVTTLADKGDVVLTTLKLWSSVPFTVERVVRVRF